MDGKQRSSDTMGCPCSAAFSSCDCVPGNSLPGRRERSHHPSTPFSPLRDDAVIE